MHCGPVSDPVWKLLIRNRYFDTSDIYGPFWINLKDMALFRIHLPGTELLDSPVRMEFNTGLFQVLFIWLSMEFSSGRGDQQV